MNCTELVDSLFPPKYLIQPSNIELLYLLTLCFSLATLSLVLALVLSFIVHAYLEFVALRPLPVPPKEPSVGSSQQMEELLGPFQTSPLAIVPKLQKPGKFRIIQNFSSPYTNNEGLRAINADIVSSDFPCTWGTFETICNIILHLPSGSQAAV